MFRITIIVQNRIPVKTLETGLQNLLISFLKMNGLLQESCNTD